jgi:hypothetical protein
MSFRILRRALVSGACALLVPSVVVVGLGLAVRSINPWLEHFIGAGRMRHLEVAYLKLAVALFPGDRDGDGVPDGVEFFQETDPRNAQDHLPMTFFLLREFGVGPMDRHGVPVGHYDVSPGIGERLPVRAAILVGSGLTRMASDYRLRLVPPEGVRLGLPGGVLEAKELVVAVSREGFVALDLDLQTPTHGFDDLNLHVENAKSGERIADLRVYGFRAETPIAASAEDLGRLKLEEGALVGVAPKTYDGPAQFRVRWPKLAPPADEALVEMAVDAENAEWHPIMVCPPGTTELFIERTYGDRDDYFLGKWGPFDQRLKYRVVLIQPTGFFDRATGGDSR